MSVTSIPSSVLGSYLSAEANLAAIGTERASGGGGRSAGGVVTGAVAPWQSASKAPKQSALVQSVLNGAAFFAGSTAQLPAGASAGSADYQNLFTLYQGVNALQGLAVDAAAKTASAADLARYDKAFQSGLSQLQTYLARTGFKQLAVTPGVWTASDSTADGPAAPTNTYTGAPLYTGPAGQVPPALTGDVAFKMTITDPVAKVSKSVTIDLAGMNAAPRTLPNVVNYINSQLKPLNVITRFAVSDTKGVPVTSTTGGKTTTVYTPADSYGLKINGAADELVSFAPLGATTPAVFLAAASAPTGAAGADAGGSTAGASLLKFDGADGSAKPLATTALAAAAGSALATATSPDGSVYVLANETAASAGGPVRGAQDAALLKFDSTGALVYRRDLGEAGSASGLGLAVSADGTKIAVTGEDQASAAANPESFVSVYSAAGDALWSAPTAAQASTSKGAAVVVQNDGSVYLAGSSTGRLQGATSLDGGTRGFVEGFSAEGTKSFLTQFGAGAVDPAGIAVANGQLYVAGSEGGQATVRSFDISGGSPASTATRVLGGSGETLAGIGVSSAGTLLVAGTSTDGAVAVGGATNAWSAGPEGFVAALDPSLSTGADALTYVPGPSGLKVSGMTVANDEVYLAGSTAAVGASGGARAYAAAVDPATGAIGWSTTYALPNADLKPGGVAVAAAGVSSLDALGLPTSLAYAPSDILTTSTPLAAGESFTVQSGSGPAHAVTIAADDTFKTLAAKIASASGNLLKASVVTVSGKTQLKIVPANSTAQVTLGSGPEGSDALAALGLSPGVITDRGSVTATASRAAFVTLGLNLPDNLSLGDPASAKTALTALNLAAAKIENAYQTLSTPPAKPGANAGSSAMSPQMKAQIANYEQAVAWLQNNASSGSSGGGLTSLFSTGSSSSGSGVTSLF